MAEENVATVSGEVESAEIQEEETEETPETTEEETEASTDEDEGGSEDEDTDEEEESDDSEEESEESTEDDDSKGHKKTAQDRIQQLANEKRELAQKIADLESKFNEQQEKAEHAQVVDVAALNDYLGKLADQVEDLRLEGRHLEANLKEDERLALVNEYKDYQKQQKERESRITTAQTQQQQRQSMLQSFDEACIFLAKENGVHEETFEMMGKEFSAMTQEDKVFAKQVLETLEFNGPVHAAKIVHEAIKERLKQKEERAAKVKTTKDEAKKSTVQKSSSAKGKKDPEKMTTEEWVAWREKQLTKP